MKIPSLNDVSGIDIRGAEPTDLNRSNNISMFLRLRLHYSETLALTPRGSSLGMLLLLCGECNNILDSFEVSLDVRSYDFLPTNNTTMRRDEVQDR